MCVCTIAASLAATAVLAQPQSMRLPGQPGQQTTPSWQLPWQGVRTLYMTAFDGSGSALATTVIAARNRAGDMVKATTMFDNVHFVADVGTKTLIEVTHPQYGSASLELALPVSHNVMVDIIFYGPNRVEAQIHGQGVNLSSVAAGGVAAAHPACPGDGDCCADGGNGTPGCDNEACCNLVCDTLDAFCCDSSWDGLCATAAQGACEICMGPACPLDCPPGALDEGEPCLVDEDTDVTNGGCNETPPVFTDASCGDTFCGQVSTYLVGGGANRDTDWYMVDHPGGDISATLVSQFQGVCFIVDGVGPGGVPCSPAVVGDIGCSADCANIQVAGADLPAGTVVVFVSSGSCAGGSVFDGIPCGSGNDYVLTIDCEGPCQSDDDCPPGQVCVDGECIVPLPSNDTCDTATLLDVPSGGSTDILGTTINATGPDAECVTATTAPGVWYKVIGTGNTMTASTCNQADYDTKISIFCGQCPTGGGSDCCIANGTPGCDDPECEATVCAVDPFCCNTAWDSICAGEAVDMCEICAEGDLICVDGQDDTAGCAGLTTEISWCAKAASQYFILVHGFGSATGNFTLTVSDDGAACTPVVDCPAACQSDDDCPAGFICVGGECIEEPTGACCQCDGSDQFCTIETEADCLAFGGLYLGDDTSCESGGNVVIVESAPNITIPDNVAGGASDTINMGMSFDILDLDVDLTVAHTWTGDLCVTLSKDGGPAIELIRRPGLDPDTCGPGSCCGCPEDNWAGIILDDEGGGGPIEGACAENLSSPPNYVPNNPLSFFDGIDSAGAWTLTVSDGAAGDIGTFVSWSLHFTQPAGGLTPCEEAYPGACECPQEVIWAVLDEDSNDSQLAILDLGTGVLTAVGPLHPGADIEGMAFYEAGGLFGVSGTRGDPHDLSAIDHCAGTITPGVPVDFGGLEPTQVTGMATDGNGVVWSYVQDVGFATIASDGNWVVEVPYVDPVTRVDGVAASDDGSTLWAMTNDGRILEVDVASDGVALLDDLSAMFDDKIENLVRRGDELLFLVGMGNDVPAMIELVTYSLLTGEVVSTVFDKAVAGDVESIVLACITDCEL
ncbi:MAG: hypothetical protein ACYSU7_09975 [Planctomycetota bacterium]